MCIDRWKSDKAAYMELKPGISMTRRYQNNQKTTKNNKKNPQKNTSPVSPKWDEFIKLAPLAQWLELGSCVLVLAVEIAVHVSIIGIYQVHCARASEEDLLSVDSWNLKKKTLQVNVFHTLVQIRYKMSRHVYFSLGIFLWMVSEK